jgi:hypothetical protein
VWGESLQIMHRKQGEQKRSLRAYIRGVEPNCAASPLRRARLLPTPSKRLRS